MEAIISPLGSTVVECCKCLSRPIWLNIKKIFKLKSNVDALENNMRSLLDTKKQIQDETEYAEVDGYIRTPQVRLWLTKVEDIQTVVTTIQEEVTANKPRLHGCSPNCYLRCKLSQQVAEKLKQVRQLLEESLPRPLVMVNHRLQVVEQRPGPSIINQNKASENLERVMDQLKADKVRTIGVWGMGGVGKTTLVNNLNNNLCRSNVEELFGIVIWITVSKDADTKHIQHRLAERLKLEISGAETIDGLAIRISSRLMKENKFLFILDDLWERVDMDKVGVPRPEVHTGYKVLLTTRFRHICREMATDAEVPVMPLCQVEAWGLFGQTVGDVVNLEPVKPFATAVCKECAGLPLAILVVGRAMRQNTKIDSWKNALRALQRSNPAPHIQGVEKEVFLPLKFSYDSLDGKTIRACFLFCCLYPEDFNIPIMELLQCWLAEGLLDEQQEYEETRGAGIALIQTLEDSCLLESGVYNGTVKMHDVIRDFAIWIASNSEDGHKSLVQSGFLLDQITRMETWGSYQRISYRKNNIRMLPDCVTQCSQVSSLLLGHNHLQNVPFEFLQGFKTLRVLDLCHTYIESLPQIEHLGELRTLLLKDCFQLKVFPSLRGLCRLQVLDLSGTKIETIPHEKELLKELRMHKHLVELHVGFTHVPNFTSEDTVWLRRLRRSSLGINRDTAFYPQIQDFGLYIEINKLQSWTQPTLVLLRHATSLSFSNGGISEIWRGLHVGGLDFLKYLSVNSMVMSTDLTDESEYRCSDQVLLPRLESFQLSFIQPGNMFKFINQFGTNLRIIEIMHCKDLIQVFPLRSLPKLQNLEVITVRDCRKVMEIIEDDSTTPTNTLPNLRSIKLVLLPRLKSICEQVIPWSYLERIEVQGCPSLKNLPLSSQHANTIKLIKGQQDWWDKLQWQNDDTKLSLQQHFHPY